MPLSLSGMCQSIMPSVTLAIDAKAKALKAAGVDVIGFGAGEPDFNTPENICDAAKLAISSGKTRYTPSSGIAELRRACAKKLLADNGLAYSEEMITITNGAKQALLETLLAIVNPGDEVIIPTPCWVSYPEMVGMAGGKPVFAAMEEADDGGFALSYENITKAVTPKTKAIIINSPQNPTGMVASREQLERVAELAVKHAFYIISDEIYEKLIYDGAEHVSIASLSPEVFAQTITINGVSKSYAMTGWRIGYVAAPQPIAKLIGSYQSHATSNACSIAQWAALEALTGDSSSVDEMRDAFAARRKLMMSEINAIPRLSCSPPSGAFYMMMNIGGILGGTFRGTPVNDAMTFAQLLLEHAHVAVVPGEAFEAPLSCRLSYACSEADIRNGLARIREFVAEIVSPRSL